MPFPEPAQPMPRRLALAFFVCLVVLLPAALSTPARADRIQSLQSKIAAAQSQEARLQSDIGSIEGKIRTLESQVGGVSTKLDALEHDLRLQQERLNRIRALYLFQSRATGFVPARVQHLGRPAQRASDPDVRVGGSDDARRPALEPEPRRLPRPDRLRERDRLAGRDDHEAGARRARPLAIGSREDEGDQGAGRVGDADDRGADGRGPRREGAAPDQREGAVPAQGTQEDAARVGAAEQGRVPPRGRGAPGRRAAR